MESEIDYKAIFNSAVAPVLVLTPEFVIVAANDSYLEVTERTRADLLGRHVFTAFPSNPEDPNDPDAQGAEVLRASLARVVATGRPDTMALQRYDIEAGPRMFEERYWSAVNAPVLGPDGEVKLIIHRAEEVTGFLRQLKRCRGRGVTGARAEREEMATGVYARAYELLNLSERLKQAYRQQGQSVSALREAIERQRRFVFDASHDLRNPITGLLTELEVALAEPSADTELQPILRKLLRDAERLNDLVADLLELSRLGTATPAATEPVDLAHLVMDELERRTLTAAVVAWLDEQVVVRPPRSGWPGSWTTCWPTSNGTPPPRSK
jgi:signal transduction histidine kinase